MRDSEEAVRKVLEGLRDVEAPAGMESRIVMALQHRAVEPAPTAWHSAWRLAPLSSVAVRSLAGGITFAGLVCALLWTPKLSRTATVPVVNHFVRSQTLAKTRSAPALPPQRQDGRLRRAKGVQESAVDRSDALAMAETRAPSQPAPPLPLTEQEQLLMRVAHRHDPEQVAMLNPEMRSKQELQAKVEFQEFFKPTRLAEEKRDANSTDKNGDAQ